MEENGIGGIDCEEGDLPEDAEGDDAAEVREQGDQAEKEDGDEDNEEYGEREVKKVSGLVKPSPDIVEAHERTHLPFRSWC
jgi:hypothetical protein